jgi:hypothetical protein
VTRRASCGLTLVRTLRDLRPVVPALVSRRGLGLLADALDFGRVGELRCEKVGRRHLTVTAPDRNGCAGSMKHDRYPGAFCRDQRHDKEMALRHSQTGRINSIINGRERPTGFSCHAWRENRVSALSLSSGNSHIGRKEKNGRAYSSPLQRVLFRLYQGHSVGWYPPRRGNVPAVENVSWLADVLNNMSYGDVIGTELTDMFADAEWHATNPSGRWSILWVQMQRQPSVAGMSSPGHYRT